MSLEQTTSREVVLSWPWFLTFQP